LNAEQTVLDLR